MIVDSAARSPKPTDDRQSHRYQNRTFTNQQEELYSNLRTSWGKRSWRESKNDGTQWDNTK